MTDQVVKSLTDPAFLIALLVGIAVFATIFTVMPALGGNSLKSRMKSVVRQSRVGPAARGLAKDARGRSLKALPAGADRSGFRAAFR